MWLALVTHPLLDTMTVYGTHLLLPFIRDPLGVGSIFIIDPLYTVPLLIGAGVALARRDGHGLRWNQVGLVVSTAYLLWSVLVQWHVRGIAQEALAARGTPATQLLVTPTPINTVLWRVLAMRPDGGYDEGFYSLLDAGRPPRFAAHEGTPRLQEEIGALPAVQRLARFSGGFYRLHQQGDQAWVTDLRMGQEPHYVFSFLVARRSGGTWEAVEPQLQGSRPDVGRSLAWLWDRMRGRDVAPPG
jgi:inner membrane protein